MQTTLTTLGGLRRSLEITVSAEELEPFFEQAYRDVQKNLQLEGFRKGKVPLELIKARFGEQIESDALSDVATETFRQAAEQHALDVIGTPVLKEVSRTSDRGARFVVEFEVMPDIQLQPYELVEVVKPVREITEADIDEEIENLRLRAARLEPAEQITDSMYVVKLRFVPVDPQTNVPLVGGHEQEFFLDDERMDPLLRSELINLRVGDTFVYRTHHEAGAHGSTEPHEHAYHVTVQQVQKVVLPELTEEFIRSVSGGRLSTEAELREDVRAALQQAWEREVTQYMRERVVDALVELHDFEVPEQLVRATAEEFADETLERSRSDERTKQVSRQELVEYFLPQAEHAVRWQLIADTILRTENITLDRERVAELARRYGVDPAQLELALQHNAQLRNRLITDALFDFLFSRVRVVEKPYDELLTDLS